MKVWVAQTDNNQGGFITGGHIEPGAVTHFEPGQTTINFATNGGKYQTSGSTPPISDYSGAVAGDVGYQAPSIFGIKGQTSQAQDTQAYSSFVSRGVVGSIDKIQGASEGATVRWTDTNQFEIIPTINYNKVAYTNARGVSYNSAVDEVFAQNYDVESIPGLQSGQLKAVNVLGNTDSTVNLQPRRLVEFYQPANLSPTVGTASGLAVSAGGYAYGMAPLMTNDQYMHRQPFTLVEGVQPNSMLNVQVVWNLEFRPNNLSPIPTYNCPSDPGWDTVVRIVSDPRAFPIVVKGHSFFKWLKNALRKVKPIAETAITVAETVAGAL